MTNKTALATQDGDDERKVGYALTASASAEIVKENLGGGNIQVTDLPRVKFPSGGGIAWEIPTLDGYDTAKELTGVVVYQQVMRRYWAHALDEGGGGSPPDCQSPDGITGYGKPGGDCASCPLNEFGSDGQGRGKACKEVKGVFLLQENSMLPTFISVPATSLKPLRQFMLALANRSLRYYDVEVGLSLEKAQNATGITYALLKPRMVRELDEGERQVIRAYKGELEPVLGEFAARAAASSD